MQLLNYKKSLDQNVGEDIFDEEEAQQETVSDATANDIQYYL